MPLEKVICVGLDHTSSDRSVRLLVGMTSDWSDGIMRRVKALDNVIDTVVLSTCNRNDVYVTVPYNISEKEQEHITDYIQELFLDLAWHRYSKRESRIISLVPDEKLMDQIGLVGDDRAKVPCPIEARARCEHQISLVRDAFIIRDHAQTHLIRTAMGLNSALIGDTKIFEQVKKAHKRALKGDFCTPGKALDKLCRFAIESVEKFQGGRPQFLSHGAVAGFLTNIHIEEIQVPNILIIGSDSEALAACINATLYYSGKITICSDPVRAEEISNKTKRAHPGRENAFKYEIVNDLNKISTSPDVIIYSESNKALTPDVLRSFSTKSTDSCGAPYPILFIDLTQTVCIETLEKTYDLWTINKDYISKNFGNSMKTDQNRITQLETSANQAQLKYEQWKKEREISDNLKMICLGIDQSMNRKISAIKKTSFCQTEIEEIRKDASKQKHACVIKIREEAGLASKSRTL